jgi:polysaccharide biosynthesis/export protein
MFRRYRQVVWKVREGLKRCFPLLVGIAGSLLLTSCATVTPVTYPFPAPVPQLLLSPGDEIEVRFAFYPEYSDVQVIRPDGRISMPLIDEVQAAGITPDDLDKTLTSLYQAKLVEPEITVVVRALGGRKIYVGGEVLFPGVVELRDKMTVLDAVVAAGGWVREHAEPSTTVVVRHVGGSRMATTVDLTKEVQCNQTLPLYLAPNDVVYVPQSKISRADQWVEQYINRLIPFTPFSATEQRGNSTIGFGI